MKTDIPERQLLMFETLFTDVLNPEHELLRTGRLIDWDGLHEALSVYYSPVGRHGKSIRLMVGIHILKHRYNCSDDRAVEMLHENAYWQCFCGFNTFQSGQFLDSTSMVKFRNRIGTEGMKRIETVLLHAWSEMGLVKTRRVAVDTTPQPKNIAYPTDADLLHRIKEKIVKQIARVRKEVTLRKPFRTFSRTGKRILLGIKKFHRANPEARQEAIGKLKEMTDRGGQHPLQSGTSGIRASVESVGLSGEADHRPDGRSAPGQESDQASILSARKGCGRDQEGKELPRLRVRISGVAGQE
jgi:IS5 family transposase